MTTRVLGVVADAVVYSAKPDTNYPTNIQVAGFNTSFYRSFLQFGLDFSNVRSITQAGLWVRTYSDPVWVGSSQPLDMQIDRVIAGWSEAGLTWNNQPNAAGTAVIANDTATVVDTWYAYDITTLVNAWFGGASNFGLRLMHVNETGPPQLSSFTDRLGSYPAYILLDYEEEAPPLAPTLVSPTAGAQLVTPFSTFTFTHHDPNGDNSMAFQLQIADVSFNVVRDVAFSAAVVANGANINWVSDHPLSYGQYFYWRALTWDSTGRQGPWSAWRVQQVGNLPVATLVTPGAGNVAAPLEYVAGSEDGPNIKPVWSTVCPDGHPQSAFKIRLYDEAGTTQLTDEFIAGAATTYSLHRYDVVNGTKYQVSVQATCSLGIEGPESAKRLVRARWGRAVYRADLGSAPLTLSAAPSAVANSGQVVLEYASSAAATPQPTDWKAIVAEVVKQRYAWYRATLLPQAVAAPTSPQLLSLTWNYSNNVLVPDGWVMGGGAGIDLGTYVYGTQSLKLEAGGSPVIAYQDVPVLPNTIYILSGRVKTAGAPDAKVRVLGSDLSTVLVDMAAASDTDWTPLASARFDSGANSSVRVQCRTDAATGTAWVDALKLEASQVVTPWTPGFLGEAVTIDAGGVQVDASKGGVFRLRGESGGSGDTVSLGNHGLRTNTSEYSAGTSFPAGPAAGDRCWRTDRGMEYYWDGTRWLSTQVFTLELGPSQRALLPYTTTWYLNAPVRSDRAMYLIGWDRLYYHALAQSGSVFWYIALTKAASDGVTSTLITDTSTGGNTVANRFYSDSVAFGHLLAVTDESLQINGAISGGAPGSLYFATALRYREVG